MKQQCNFYIIIAVLNAESSIENCLKSVFDQQYSQKKIIVVDGGSSDKTVDIIKKNSNKIYWWVSEKDDGIYDAWNKAVTKVNDGWVLFLGADDVLFSPDVLSHASELLQECDVKIAYGQIAVVNAQEKTLAIKGAPWSVAGRNFTSTMTLPHQGIFHHSSVFAEFGVFNPYLKIAGDFDLLLRILPAVKPLYLEGQIIAKWRVGGISYDVRTSLNVAHEFSKVRCLNGYHGLSATLMWFYTKAYVLQFFCCLFGHRFTTWFAGAYRRALGQWK